MGGKYEYTKKLRLNFPTHCRSATTPPLWRQQEQGKRYSSLIEIFDEPTRKLVRVECEGQGTFEYVDDAINITWRKEGTGFEHYLQTIGLSLWLEMRGVPCIHANAVATEAGVVGFIAPSQTGKTTLTAALATQGMAMMTDDMMAIHKTEAGWKVYPGWPQLRMWPQVAEHFIKNMGDLQQVHSRFEKRLVNLDEQAEFSYTNESGLLKRLYVLERTETQNTGVSIQPVTAAESILTLLQNSMLADAYRPLGIESSRLALLAELLETVQVKRIVYPSGKQYLTKVFEHIKAEIGVL